MKKNTIIKSLLLSSALLFTGTALPVQDTLHLHHNVAKAEEADQETYRYSGRQVIKNSLEYPYNTVAKVQAPYQGGTGFVVGENKVLTNRHVVEAFLKTPAGISTAKVILAQNEGNTGDKNLGEYKIKGYKFAPNDIDVAILEVEPNKKGEHIGKVVTPGRLVNESQITSEWIKKKPSTLFHTAGYPGDRDKRYMWYSDGGLLDIRGLEVDGAFKAYPGASGSPIFDQDNNIIGIVRAYAPKNKDASGLLFRGELLDFLKENSIDVK